MLQFVIQKHTRGKSFHFDLMLACPALSPEMGGTIGNRRPALKTWRLPQSFWKSKCQIACRLPDHRLKYLSYEGKISRGRGRVVIWDKGVYRIKRWRDNLVVFQLQGKKIKGEYCLVLWPSRSVKAGQIIRGKRKKWLLVNL
ncbi:MAG: DNA polymerase ligase N-terminal domain-containing protein [Planctomycetota bacterium]